MAVVKKRERDGPKLQFWRPKIMTPYVLEWWFPFDKKTKRPRPSHPSESNGTGKKRLDMQRKLCESRRLHIQIRNDVFRLFQYKDHEKRTRERLNDVSGFMVKECILWKYDYIEQSNSKSADLGSIFFLPFVRTRAWASVITSLILC